MTKRTKSAQELRRIGAAEAYCDSRLALGRVTLSLSDLTKESELSAIAAKRQRVLDGENEPGVAQRLGFVVESCGNKSLAKTVRDWLPDELTPVALVPAKGKRDNLPLVKRWQVLNNSCELKV